MASVCEITTTSTAIRFFLQTVPTTVERTEWHVMVGGMSAGAWRTRADAEEACALIDAEERRAGADAALSLMDSCAALAD